MSIIKVHDRNFQPFISEEEIKSRVSQIADSLTVKYHDKNPLFLAVLNGAFILAADLVRSVKFQSEISFTKISSYQGTTSTGMVKQLIGFTESITNRHVIIVEDIIDTGLSMQHILQQVKEQSPASIQVVTLLFKRDSLKVDIQPDYVGFEIPSKFVLGYGLDYDGLGRNLPDIYVEQQG
ncbi:MAG: hypoxanthine phosphoribosyltransferase [Bacteroidia bacterium]|jgi:hypoxanthine phosphoribosyltransferase|nr:hypoxanthine phosphoribosyltransferase [Bacteroidia bacterium]